MLTMAPHIKHTAHKFLSSEVLTEVPLLHFHLDRLESALVPLFDGDALPVLTETLHSLDKLLERVVTLGVELAVLEELVHCFLLALLEHVFQQDEREFGNQQFVVVPIVALHLSSFS